MPPEYTAARKWLEGNIIPNAVVTAGKPQLPYHSGGRYLPLPYTGPQRLLSYMQHYRSKWLVMTGLDMEARPPLESVWQGHSKCFRRVFQAPAELDRNVKEAARRQIRVFERSCL